MTTGDDSDMAYPEPPPAAAAPQQPIVVSNKSSLASLAIMAILIIGIVVSSAAIDAEAVEGILSDPIEADVDGDGTDEIVSHNPKMKEMEFDDTSGGKRETWETGSKPVEKVKLSDGRADETVIVKNDVTYLQGWDFADFEGGPPPAGDPPEVILLGKDHEYGGTVPDEGNEENILIICHGGDDCKHIPWDVDGDGDMDVEVAKGDPNKNAAYNEENIEVSTGTDNTVPDPVEADVDGDGTDETVTHNSDMKEGEYTDTSGGNGETWETGDKPKDKVKLSDNRADETVILTNDIDYTDGWNFDDLSGDPPAAGDPPEVLIIGKDHEYGGTLPEEGDEETILIICHGGSDCHDKYGGIPWDYDGDGDNDVEIIRGEDWTISHDSHNHVDINVIDSSDNEALDLDDIRVEVRDEKGRLIGDEKLSSLPAGDYTVEVSVKMLNHDIGMATQEFSVDEGQEAQVTISVSTMLLSPDDITPAVNAIAGGIFAFLSYALVRNATASRGFVRSFTMGAVAGAATFGGSYWGLAMGLG